MGEYSIEIRVGVGTGESHSTIHTWVQITRPDGSSEAWGLYPQEQTLGNIIDGLGEVRAEDIDKPYTASSGPITISDSQYYDFRGYLPTFPSQSPNYSIPL